MTHPKGFNHLESKGTAQDPEGKEKEEEQNHQKNAVAQTRFGDQKMKRPAVMVIPIKSNQKKKKQRKHSPSPDSSASDMEVTDARAGAKGGSPLL